MRVLVVDDDVKLSRAVARGPRNDGACGPSRS
jgi:hypothetical protein